MNTRFVLTMYILGLTVSSAVLQAQPRELDGIRGTVFTVDSNGAKSFVAGALVTLSGASLSTETSSTETGTYSFAPVPPGIYRIDVTSTGLSGSKTVTLDSGSAFEISIELAVNAVKASVTVTAEAEPPVMVQPVNQAVIDKATIANAPNRNDHVDALLPLIPGVVRGPDGLINMKGARASQGGSLVNNENATDPVTGNASVNLPIDVVDSVKVIANPYDPEYGRLTGAIASVETITGRMNSFHVTAQNLLVRPRKRDNDFVGIESATPRITVTGPRSSARLSARHSGILLWPGL